MIDIKSLDINWKKWLCNDILRNCDLQEIKKILEENNITNNIANIYYNLLNNDKIISLDINWKKWLCNNILDDCDLDEIKKILEENNINYNIADIYYNLLINNIFLIFNNEIEIKLLLNIFNNKPNIFNYFKNENIIRIENFFDENVAEYIYSIILKQEFILLNKPLNNTKLKYSFRNVNYPTKELKNIYFLIKYLFSSKFKLDISCSKYSENDGIETHTDEQGYINNNKKYFRKYAIIFYFNKNWKKENGGELYDIENNIKYLPIFNSCIIFKIPHKHSVMPIIKGDRYSIFGWFIDLYNNQYYLPENRFINKDNFI